VCLIEHLSITHSFYTVILHTTLGLGEFEITMPLTQYLVGNSYICQLFFKPYHNYTNIHIKYNITSYFFEAKINIG